MIMDASRVEYVMNDVVDNANNMGDMVDSPSRRRTQMLRPSPLTLPLSDRHLLLSGLV